MPRALKIILRITAIVLAVLLLAGMVTVYFVAASIYDSNFNFRITTRPRDTFELAEFEGLTAERHTFVSDKGQQLVGYLYAQQDPAPEEKAVVVFAHGFGAGGQVGYMDLFDYLTRQGYYVFAYDATANDESEGDKVGGLPQGYIDLDHAIDYAGTIPALDGMPVMLMGYSWGAISVSNVLNYHPEVEAVVALAGCNRSLDLIEHRGREMVGDWVALMMPFAQLHEFFLFGDYTFSTAMDGFAKSDCRVMIVHGEWDKTVPIQYGYDTYYKKYGDDPRFVFKRYEKRAHSILEAHVGILDMELLGEIAAFFDESLPVFP